jgi:hypothetical protein
MLRSILLAATIGFLAGSTPASAQNFTGSCRDWCQQNRCGHGVVNAVKCFEVCVPACQKKNPKAKP